MDDAMAVVEVAKKRLTAEEWQAHLEAQALSGLRVSEYCARNSISKHQYYYWREKLRGPRAAHTSDAFVECRIGKAVAEDGTLMLECPGGYRLHMGPGCGLGIVEGVLEVLKKCSAC